MDKDIQDLPDEAFINHIVKEETLNGENNKADEQDSIAPEEDSQTTEDTSAESLPENNEVDPSGSTDEDSTDKQEESSEEPSMNYEEFYRTIMQPFKANGKMIELKDPHEAIQLMQKGANYTRNLQDIAPYKKALMMLKNADLLNTDDISLMIDLKKKDPEALKKYFQDTNIDPLDIDLDTKVNYQPKTYTDSQVQLASILDELKQDVAGQATIDEIDNRWDINSKNELLASPDLLNTIHFQREQGIYNQITTEMDRLIAIGSIPPNTPFLQAYQQVGNMLVNAQTAQATTNKVVAVDTYSNNKKKVSSAKRAGPTRHNSTKTDPFMNLNLSDEEFLKHMEGKL